MPDKTNRLSICLIKDTFDNFEDIVVPGTKAHVIPDVGTFYGKPSFVRSPDWVNDFFGMALAGQFEMRTASAQGLLLVEVDIAQAKRVLGVVFGHGRHLLVDGVVEERFGLKVVLNSVDRAQLRSIDKTALGAIPKQSREQMSREVDASSFGIDIEQDLLTAVTGRSNDPRLGKIISGRDVLAISVKKDLTNIKAFLPVLLEKYESNAYKAAGFEWIDQIKDVRDPAQITALDGWLIGQLQGGDLDKVWMAPPSVINWVDVEGFRYGGEKRPPIQIDLDVATFLATFGGAPLTTEMLKSKRVHAISAATDEPLETWNAYRCIYAEANLDGRVYILNNGKWYEIAADFTAAVLADFEAMPESQVVLPDYVGGNEAEYNVVATAALDGAFCLDADVIPHGGGHSSVEFCDVLSAHNQLIHVKRYSGSAQLSHLFNQGVVSAELFVAAPDFREKLNAKLPAELKLADTAQRPVANEYEVVFAVVMPSGKELEIPFFSKVSLRNARQRLAGYGYAVTKKKINTVLAA
jgi:uncharacterized protein (TIGR04141 family)